MTVETLKHEGPGRLGIARIRRPHERRIETPTVDLSVSPFNSLFNPQPASSLEEYDLTLAPSLPLGFYSPEEVVAKVLEKIGEIDYGDYNTFYLPALKNTKMLDGFLRILEDSGNEFEAVYVGNSRQLTKNYREFVETLKCLRERLPNTLIVMDVEPFFYPLAVYLGVDAFDTRSLKLYDFEGRAFTPYSPFVWSEGANSEEFSRSMIEIVRRAMEEDRLRQIVENFLHTASHEGILRIADVEYGDYLEEYTPTTPRTIYFISNDSMRRPEVGRWQRRVLERFEPPKNTKLVLLLPCSAKKPYSLSRSHVLYRKVVREAVGNGIHVIHDLILTSPLGVVPREWERLAKYDIVVTGHWSREEVESSAELLAKTLEKYPKDIPVVAHLDGPYVDIAKEAAEMSGRDVVFTNVEGSTTSRESLNSLKEVLSSFKDDLEVTRMDRRYRSIDWIRKIFDYYLGKGAGTAVLPEGNRNRMMNRRMARGMTRIRVRGSKILTITVDGQQTGTIKDAAISLTPFGMQRVYDATKSYWVEVDFDLRGDVFAVGVNGADERIRPGDIVGIIRDGEVIGVGRAVLSGREMLRARRGVAVKVKKRKK
ncbi:MAG: RNA-binding protein [Thermococci archaeon]|nr:RNA-binding protein [Thermococci archaeon]